MSEELNIKGSISIDTDASAKSVNELNAEIKKTKDVLNNAKIGSEEYILAQKKLIQQQSQLGAATQQQVGQFGNLKKSLQDQVPAMAGVTSGAGLFNQALNMLRANPIIAVITIVTLLFVKLWERFKAMEGVADALGKAFGVFGMIIDRIVNAILKPLIDAFIAVADAASSVASFIGGLFSPGLEEAANRAGELTEALDDLEDAEKRNALQLYETNAALKEARERADDANLPIEERIKFLEQARDMERKTIAESVENNRARAMANLELMALEIDASDNLIGKIREGSYESLKAAREIMANLDAIDKEKLYKNDEFLKGMMQGQADIATVTKKTNKQIESLNKEAQDAKEAAAKEAAQKAKERQQKAEQDAKAAQQAAKAAAAKAAQEAKAKKEQDYQHSVTIAKQNQEIELNNITDAYQKELKQLEFKHLSENAAIKKQFDDKKITQSQYDEVTKNAKIIQQQQVDAIELKHSEDKIRKERELQNEINKINIDIRMAGITDVREKEKLALSLAFDDKLAQAKERYKSDLDSFNAVKAVIDLQQKEAEKALQAKYDEEDNIARETLSLRKIGFQMAQNATDFQMQRDLLDSKQAIIESQYLREQAAAQGNVNKLREIEQGHTETLKEITDARILIAHNERQAKIQALDAVSQTLQNASNLFGKATLASKLLGIASATISTFISAQKAYESTIGIPIVGPILAPINAGLAVAAGIKNIKEIAKVNVPGQSGGGSVPTAPTVATAPISPQQQGTTLDQSSINAVGNAAQNGVNRAFVLDADIQNNGQLNTRINRAARLG